MSQPLKKVKLGDLLAVLPPGTQDAVLAGINDQTLSDPDFTSKMKVLLRPFATQLETVGVIPDYLAYMLLFVKQQHLQTPRAKDLFKGNPGLN